MGEELTYDTNLILGVWTVHPKPTRIRKTTEHIWKGKSCQTI